MSKTRVFAFFLLGIIIAAILTNPKREQFENVIEDKAKFLLIKQLDYESQEAVQLGMTLFGNRIIKEFVQNNVVIENYYLFSVVKINWQGQSSAIGGGAFKTVWLSPEIDRKADEIVRILRKL